MEAQINLIDIAIGAALGLLWGIYGFMSNRKKNPEEELDTLKLGSTLLVFGIAGAIIAARGDAVSYDELDALVIILAPIVDDLLNDWLGVDGPQMRMMTYEEYRNQRRNGEDETDEDEFTRRQSRRRRR